MRSWPLHLQNRTRQADHLHLLRPRYVPEV